MSEGTKAVKEVKSFLEKNKPDLVITDVPKEALKMFKDFANSDEFACEGNKGGHYGFALKFLLDSYFGRIPNGVQELQEEVSLLQDRIAEVDNQKEETNVIKLCNGAEMKIGG